MMEQFEQFETGPKTTRTYASSLVYASHEGERMYHTFHIMKVLLDGPAEVAQAIAARAAVNKLKATLVEHGFPFNQDGLLSQHIVDVEDEAMWAYADVEQEGGSQSA